MIKKITVDVGFMMERIFGSYFSELVYGENCKDDYERGIRNGTKIGKLAMIWQITSYIFGFHIAECIYEELQRMYNEKIYK